ncbi:MAG TPA: tryptophan synthase subunit alpha [Jiangellaceae bacterium]
MNRLVRRLRWSRAGHRLFLVAYLPAGYPTGAEFTASVRASFDAGADAMEISLPNPPLAVDGPLIQEAAGVGARHVDGPADALRRAAAGRVHDSQAIIALAYRHAFDQLGGDALIATCVDAGADAILLPEHSMAEQLEFAHRARAAGLEQVLFLYLEEDLPRLSASGLEDPVIYLQSADLRTGGQFDPAKATERLGELRAALQGRDAFVLVGFGIRGRDAVSSLRSTTADGVIVGTAVVAAAREGASAVGTLVEHIQAVLPKRVETVEAHG